MTELQLYKFCQDKEMRWELEKLLIWIPFYCIDEFTQIIGYNLLDEGGLTVYLQDRVICLDLIEICEYYDIDPENILSKEVD